MIFLFQIMPEIPSIRQMKNFPRLSCIFLVTVTLTVLPHCSKDRNQGNMSAAEGRITISGSWALYPMVVRWSEAYQKKNPHILIDISAGGAGKGMTDVLTGSADLGMVSREINPAEKEKGAWWISVVKDAVVPTINEKNPLLDQLLRRGLTRKDVTRIWLGGPADKWNIFIKHESAVPLHAYTRSDACGAAETWANFIGGNQEELKGIGIYGDPGIADAVRNDRYGIAYNNINFAFDAKTGRPISGIRILPLDLNGNGIIDGNENFYSDSASLMNAIARGSYPSPPARNLHLVSKGIPEKRHILEFLAWILEEGQNLVDEAGYIPVSKEKILQQKSILKQKLGQQSQN